MHTLSLYHTHSLEYLSSSENCHNLQIPDYYVSWLTNKIF